MKIAYIMSRFPHLPETFILREMNELDNQGWDIHLYPLIFQQQKVIHAEAKKWIPRAHATPYLSAAILLANLKMLGRKPGRYVSTLGKVMAGTYTSPNIFTRSLILFPKAVFLAGQMQKEGIDHIHAHYATHPATVAWIIHNLTGIPYSITCHAHDIFARTEFLKTKFQDARTIIAISEYNREYIAWLVGDWVKPKTCVIHCGINPNHYKFCQPYIPSASGRFEIISVTSLKRTKGQQFLVEACAILRRQNIPIHCRIIGMGREYQNILTAIAQNGLEDTVEMLGDRAEEEVAALLPSAHCYVQPSLAEGIPVAVMEAFACKLPVVATATSGAVVTVKPDEPGYPINPSEMATLANILGKIYRNTPDAIDLVSRQSPILASRSGIHELVIPDETGYLVPPADPQTLARAIRMVYDDYTHSTQMAAKGYELVMNDFNLHRNVEKIGELFQSVPQAADDHSA